MSTTLISASNPARHDLDGAMPRFHPFVQPGVDAIARLVELNGQAWQRTLDEQEAVAMQSAHEASPLAALGLNARYSLAAFAKTAAYWKHVGDIVLDAYVETVAAGEAQLERGFGTALRHAGNAAGAAVEGAADVAAAASQVVLPGVPAVEPTVDAAMPASVQIVDSEGKVVNPSAT